VVEAFRGAGVNIYCMNSSKGRWRRIRARCYRGQVVAAMKRTGAEGDFRSNLQWRVSGTHQTLT
jgi:ribosomal protein S6--L-glutamate ligase